MSRFHSEQRRAGRWQLCLLASGLCALSLVAERSLHAQKGGAQAQQQGAAQAQQAAGAQAEFVPLESGPIHEAFAEPVTLAAEAGIVVQQQPPEPVPELPPETRPQGDNVVWVPGYWAWSEERNDFIWISGVWRDVPPHQQWVPGYWTEVAQGYQWVRGFWTSAETQELVYLPAPPESLETEPTAPRPDPDHFWVPGSWRWQDGQYYWRGGFWHPAQENWVWVPAHYRYTPRGHVYLNGYWDYPLQNRGLLFAPVYFPQPTYYRSGYFFTPNSWLDVALLTTSLFVAPRYGHYYYGNYFGPRYLSAGYYPWYDYHDRPFGYDPLFAYSSWRYGGQDSDWYQNLRQEYSRRAGEGPADRGRPDVTRDPDRRDVPDRRGVPGTERDRDQTQLVRRIEELREARGENLTRIDDAQRRRAVEQAQTRIGELRRQRAEAEITTGRAVRPDADRLGEDRSRGGQRRDRERPQRDPRAGDRTEQTPAEQGDRPRADQPRPEDRLRREQPQAQQPQQERPQGEQPQQGQQGAQPRDDRRGQPREGRPGVDPRLQSRPAGPINGRFQLPAREQRGSRGTDLRGTDQSPIDGRRQQPGQRIRPQVPPRPGGLNQQRPGGFDRQRPGATEQQPPRGAQPRRDTNRGGPPSGAAPRQTPPDRGGAAPSGNRDQGGSDNQAR